jgi:hypothetical protein
VFLLSRYTEPGSSGVRSGLRINHLVEVESWCQANVKQAACLTPSKRAYQASVERILELASDNTGDLFDPVQPPDCIDKPGAERSSYRLWTQADLTRNTYCFPAMTSVMA